MMSVLLLLLGGMLAFVSAGGRTDMPRTYTTQAIILTQTGDVRQTSIVVREQEEMAELLKIIFGEGEIPFPWRDDLDPSLRLENELYFVDVVEENGADRAGLGQERPRHVYIRVSSERLNVNGAAYPLRSGTVQALDDFFDSRNIGAGFQNPE